VTEEDCIEYIYNLVNGTGFYNVDFYIQVGGKCIGVFSIKRDNRKEIYNKEVIEEIKGE